MAPPSHPYAGLKFPSRDTVAEYLAYDPETGEFRWKKTLGYKRKAGEIAGSIQRHGHDNRRYRDIGLFGHVYRASNLAWLLMTGDWPAGEIDHRNTDSLDDHWVNLRLATHAQNKANVGLRNDNTTGYKGVSFDTRKRNKPWAAKISNSFIGYYITAEDAARAYDAEAIKAYGEFAYLNFRA